MAYLTAADYAAFGLCADTAEAWITSASAMIDAHCRRPTLLVASYTERMRVRAGMRNIHLSYGPLVTVTSVRVRYAPRRMDSGFAQEIACAFGLPGAWVDVDVATLDVDNALGEVEWRESVLAQPFSETEVTYTAGLATVPDAVKVACAQIVRNAQATPALNVKANRLSGVQMEYFSDSLLDEQTRALLRPYVVERMAS